MFPEIFWFYGSPLPFAVLVIVAAAPATAVIISTVRCHPHSHGGRR